MHWLLNINRSIVAVLLVLTASSAIAAEEAKEAQREERDTGGSRLAPERSKDDDDDETRNFYQVLEDVLADYEYDIKTGNVKGLKDVSIRTIAMSENVPPSFQNHLELLITERILKHMKTRVVQCGPCRTKTAKLSGDNVIITSPDTNPAELNRIAKKSGIENFMDVSFAYQPNGLILSISTSDVESGSIVWSRSYNSETSRATAFRRGVDYSQVDEARHKTEYDPTVQSRLTLYYLFEKDVSEYGGALALGYRMVERYDNRKKEVGFEIDYTVRTAAIIGSTLTSDNSIYTIGSLNLTLLFVHAWNLIGEIENYHQVRGSIYGAIGGTYAGGFLGGVIRGGYEWRMGKTWAVSANLGFRPPASAFLGTSTTGTSISGVEVGVGISHLF